MLKNPEERKKIGEELADVLYFTLRFAELYGFDLSSELLRKIQVDAQRYPVDKARGSNRKYDEAREGGLAGAFPWCV